MANGTEQETFSNVTPVQAETFSNVAPIQEEGPGVGERLTRGYNPDIEAWAQKHPVVGPIMRFLDATGGAAIKSPEMLKDAIVDAVKSYGDPKRIIDPLNVVGNVEQARDLYKAWSDPNVRHGALSVLPEALGQATGQVAATEAGGKLADMGAPKVSTALTPVKPRLMQIAEAAIHPEQIPGRLMKAAVSTIPDAPVYPGAPLPSAEDFYANRGAELDRIRRMQDMEARRVARQTLQEQRQQRSQSPTSQGTQQSSPILQSSSPSLASEGRPATWTNDYVMQQARTGDIRAIQQARLRGLDLPPNAGLVANQSASITPSVNAPKSVTIFDAQGRPIEPNLSGGPASFRKLSLSDGEDLGPGMGTDHIIRDRTGNRVGSIQIERTGDNSVHVHWLGGEFGNARSALMDAIKEQYPGTERITYDRRRLAAGAKAATTTPREMSVQ